MEIPAVSIRSPARMKKGMARRVKESMAEKIRSVTMRSVTLPPKTEKIEENPMAKEMGVPMAINKTKQMKRMATMVRPHTL